jgi:hypothetical protein
LWLAQTLVETSYADSKDELQRVKELRQLCEDFARNATRIGKIIISELFLADSEKTIPPVTKYEEIVGFPVQ